MSPNNKEIQYECRYVGSHEQDLRKCEEIKPDSPSSDFVRTIALEVLGGRRGRFHSTIHIKKQMAERDFDVFDMEYVIRNGKCVEGGKYHENNRNHQYTFRGNIDGTIFDAVFALAADQDFIESPQIILITGCFKTKNGKRRKTY